MRATSILTNRATPVVSNRPFTLLERRKITVFLREPRRKNLPPQINTRVIDGEVFLCYAPDGKRIFLKTDYKRDVVISIRYQGGNIYAELRPARCMQKTFELFPIKIGGAIYHRAEKIDPRSLDQPGRVYHKPKIFLKTKSDKIKRGHRNERWLKDMAGTPKSYAATASTHGEIQICSYNGEPVLLRLGKRHRHRKARVSFATTGMYKQVFVRIGRKRWEFDLTCERGKCIVRLVSEPL